MFSCFDPSTGKDTRYFLTASQADHYCKGLALDYGPAPKGHYLLIDGHPKDRFDLRVQADRAADFFNMGSDTSTATVRSIN